MFENDYWLLYRNQIMLEIWKEASKKIFSRREPK